MATVRHIDVPAVEAFAQHFPPPRPAFTQSLHRRKGSKGRDLPGLTEMVRHDTSIPNRAHLPETATRAGPLTTHTLLVLDTRVDIRELPK
ncbi:MAG TPA: hypothetical protein VIB07_07265 [Nitrososphaera sp.]